jgi:hypothetical protein
LGDCGQSPLPEDPRRSWLENSVFLELRSAMSVEGSERLFLWIQQSTSFRQIRAIRGFSTPQKKSKITIDIIREPCDKPPYSQIKTLRTLVRRSLVRRRNLNQTEPKDPQTTRKPKPSEKNPQNNRRKEKPHENQDKQILLSIYAH